MGDHQGRPSAVNLCPFVGVDLNMLKTVYRAYSRHFLTPTGGKINVLARYTLANYARKFAQTFKTVTPPLIRPNRVWEVKMHLLVIKKNSQSVHTCCTISFLRWNVSMLLCNNLKTYFYHTRKTVNNFVIDSFRKLVVYRPIIRVLSLPNINITLLFDFVMACLAVATTSNSVGTFTEVKARRLRLVIG